MYDGGAKRAATSQSRRLTTVVAADICGYSRLAEIDDDAAVKTVHIVRAAFESVVAAHRGRLFHSSGDGFLAEFPSAAEGVLAALDFVAEIRARDSLSPTSPGAKVRAGVHSGDVMEQPGGDLLGHGVNIASRLQGEAEPNGVLISQATVNLVRGNVEAAFRRRGALALKNIEEPVVAFEVVKPRSPGLFDSVKDAFRGFSRISPVFMTFGILGLAILIISGSTLQATIRQDRERVSAAPTGDRIQEAIGKFSPGDKTYLDREYLSALITRLFIADTDASGAVLALLDQGDVRKATMSLTENLRDLSKKDPKWIEINHQIGAIAEVAAPAEAIAAYERILAATPRDFFAAARVGRCYLAQNNIPLARNRLELALEIGADDPRLLLQVRSHLAFTDNLDQKFERAIPKYEEIVAETIALGFEEVEIEARVSLGQAQAHSGREEAAKANFLNVLFAQPENKYTPERGRAAAGLARLARTSHDFAAAERFYLKALDFETISHRAHGRADALHGLAMVSIDRAIASSAAGDREGTSAFLKTADQRLTSSVAIAREDKLTFHEFMGLVSRAQVSEMRGDGLTACRFIDQAALLFEERSVSASVIGPDTMRQIASTNCPFNLRVASNL